MKPAFVVMAAWLVLWGCDDPPKTKTTHDTTSPYPSTVTWESSGCSSDTGKVNVEGETGKIRVDWEYQIPAILITFLILGACWRVSYAR